LRLLPDRTAKGRVNAHRLDVEQQGA